MLIKILDAGYLQQVTN